MSSEPVSIVVPTYKEARNLPILAGRVFAALDKAAIPAELIIVDDNSQDGTDAVVDQLAGEHPIRLITRTDERGLSSAVVRGFADARHDILLCMDADLSHPPESLPDVIAPVAGGGAEFCIGSRYAAGGSTKDDWGFLRRINSRGATLLARPLTNARDPMAGFFCLRRDVLERARQAGLNPIGYKIGLEILIKARCTRLAEVPIEFSDRLHGESKLTFQQQLLYVQHLVRLYRFRWPVAAPLTVIAALAAALLVIGYVLFY
ncbi:MAG: polyprenol monophosphomannose synthase [Phycisphaerae bacterium]|nr:polyprenol monophosphomannose synthase [Phycisphaerae bacterium]